MPVRFRSSLKKVPLFETLQDPGRVSKMTSSFNSPLVSSAEGQKYVGLRPMNLLVAREKKPLEPRVTGTLLPF